MYKNISSIVSSLNIHDTLLAKHKVTWAGFAGMQTRLVLLDVVVDEVVCSGKLVDEVAASPVEDVCATTLDADSVVELLVKGMLSVLLESVWFTSLVTTSFSASGKGDFEEGRFSSFSGS